MHFFALLVRAGGSFLLFALPRTFVAVLPTLLTVVESLALRALHLTFVLAIWVVVVVTPAVVAMLLFARA